MSTAEGENSRERTVVEMFAEALGSLDATTYWLGQVNEQYDAKQDELRLYGLSPSYNAALDFWLQSEQAQEQIKDILNRLQRVEPLAPKEAEPLKEEE